MLIFAICSSSKPSRLLLSFTFLTLISEPIFSLSFQSINNNPHFDSEIQLFGDAEIVNGGSSVQLTRPVPSSSGLLIHGKPFKFIGSNPSTPTSFSTDFTFSISPHNGDGLALVVVPTDFPSKISGKSSFGLSRENRFLGIEFDTAMDENVGDENANHVGVDVSSLISARVSNASSIDLVLNSGIKLRSWIDYDASSKRIEVRLSKLGSTRPYDPFLAYPIDLSEMWKQEEVFVGLSSCSGNSVQSSSVYSWNFRARSVPKWMHSQPVNPDAYSNERGEQKTAHKKSFCPLGLLYGFVFGIGCGALTAFVLLFLWEIFINKNLMIPAADSIRPVDFRYEKINLVVENVFQDGKK